MSRLCRLKNAKHGEDGKWAHDEIVSLRKQRDDLLAALEYLLTCKHGEFCDHYRDAERKARAAIASVKESK